MANHQIRTLRPHLVSTVIHFEQGYFQERIESGRLDLPAARAWFAGAQAAHEGGDAAEAFARGVVGLVAPSAAAAYPPTFTFDVERMDGLRDDLREATCLKICMLFFRQLTLGARRDLDPATCERVRAQVLAIVGDDDGVARWARGSSAVALHLAQQASEFHGHAGLADAARIRLAESWLARHLRPDSAIYARIEADVVRDVTDRVLHTAKAWAALAAFPAAQPADPHAPALDLAAVAQRVSHIAFLHWRIFGPLYLQPA